MENDDIKEGFICPICMKDLGNASVLQRHFEESHSDDKDTLRRMREAFGKAKRKIINKIESSEPDGATVDSVDGVVENPVSRGVDPFLWDQQDFGENNSYTISAVYVLTFTVCCLHDEASFAILSFVEHFPQSFSCLRVICGRPMSTRCFIHDSSIEYLPLLLGYFKRCRFRYFWQNTPISTAQFICFNRMVS